MYEQYLNLNNNSREYFLTLLNNEIKDKHTLERCEKEIDLLYNKGLLFIIELLHKYKKNEKSVSFHFKGMANNLLLLYALGISKVDPIKYILQYELFTDKTLRIDFINGCSLDFVSSMNQYNQDFKIVKGSFEPSNVYEINELEDKHYLFIPSYVQPNNMTFRLNEFNQFETIEDYHTFKDKYIIIRLDDKTLIQGNEVNLKYAMKTTFEKEISSSLKPKTIDDYAKIISLAHGTHVWKKNQEELFKQGKINIHNIISNCEDIYEYLINHSIEHDVAIEIVKQLSKSRINRSNELWQKYLNIMKEHNCDDMFINVLSKMLYIFGRGQAISECLFALDEVNYYFLED